MFWELLWLGTPQATRKEDRGRDLFVFKATSGKGPQGLTLKKPTLEQEQEKYM